jgi:hypothetical protein
MGAKQDQTIGKIALTITALVMKGHQRENIERGWTINYVLLIDYY